MKVFKLAGVLMVLMVSACSTHQSGLKPESADSVNSGFLSNYSILTPVEGREGIQRYIDRSAQPRQYHKLYIDPVQVFLYNDQASYKGVQPDVLKRISDSFHGEFVNVVKNDYEIVNEPGPDVLRIRLAITGLQPVSPPLVVSDFIPIKAVFNAGRAAVGASPRLAEISAEIEVLNSQGRTVAAAVATRKSDKTLPQNDRVTWNDLKPIVGSWAKQFRQSLDEVHGTVSPKKPKS